MPSARAKRLSTLAAAVLAATAAAPLPLLRAQDSPLPSGRLVFRSSGIEFRPDRTYVLDGVMDGIGEIRARGTWTVQAGGVELVGYELSAGAELLKQMSIPLDGCADGGRYRHVVNGTQLRLEAISDACVPRRLFLDRSRWAPPGEPNLAPPRTLVRTASAPAIALPRPGAAEGSWPSFRGPQASGVADEQHLPDRWNVETRENILWRTEIPGLAHASPIVWGNRLFVTSAISSRGNATFKTGPYGGGESADDTSPHRWMLYALDTSTGRILWERDVHHGEPRDRRHVKSTYASSTPATDGRIVVAWFGSHGLHAYSVDGTPIWKVDLGRVNVGAAGSAAIEWGPASSPVIWEDLVILQVDTQDDSFLVAFAAGTGEQVWKVERDEPPSWSTPTVVATKDGAELVVNGTNSVRGYDARTGRPRWRIKGGSPIPTPTPVAGDGVSVVASGGLGSPRPLLAVRHGAAGDLDLSQTGAEAGVAWRLTGRGPFTPTPLVYRGLLYVLANNGVLDAYDVRTGAEIYRARLPEIGSGFSASPVAADGKIYVAGEDGAMTVLAAARTFRHIATNDMGEPLMATPALSGGVMFVRGMKSLYAIGRPVDRQAGPHARGDRTPSP